MIIWGTFMTSQPTKDNKWQLFTSHGLVLISLLNKPGKTIREIGYSLDLTERAVSRAITDLIEEGYVVKTRLGRRCFYRVNEDKVLKFPLGIGYEDSPHITVKGLKAENLATHAEHLDNPDDAPVRKKGDKATVSSV